MYIMHQRFINQVRQAKIGASEMTDIERFIWFRFARRNRHLLRTEYRRILRRMFINHGLKYASKPLVGYFKPMQ